MTEDSQKIDVTTGYVGIWDRWLDPKLVVPFLQALVILLVGWWIKDSVTLAISQKQLDLANVKEMRDLVRDLLEPDQAPGDYQSAAVALAPFGTYAISIFLELEQKGTDNQQMASEDGLRAVALAQPAAVAQELRRIIRNQTGFYSYTAHLFAIRMLAQMDVGKALAELEAYQARVLSLESDSARLELLRQVVSEERPPGVDQVKRTLGTLDASIKALRQSRRASP